MVLILVLVNYNTDPFIIFILNIKMTFLEFYPKRNNAYFNEEETDYKEMILTNDINIRNKLLSFCVSSFFFKHWIKDTFSKSKFTRNVICSENKF